MVRKLMMCYETFPEDKISVLSVVDEETDTCIFILNNEEADKMYSYITQHENNGTPNDNK